MMLLPNTYGTSLEPQFDIKHNSRGHGLIHYFGLIFGCAEEFLKSSNNG
jgi:hypothetical protein